MEFFQVYSRLKESRMVLEKLGSARVFMYLPPAMMECSKLSQQWRIPRDPPCIVIGTLRGPKLPLMSDPIPLQRYLEEYLIYRQ